jgi:hypothetical protein
MLDTFRFYGANPGRLRKEDKMKKNETIYMTVDKLRHDLEDGKLTRREFLRYATFLGISAATPGWHGPVRSLPSPYSGGGPKNSIGLFQMVCEWSQICLRFMNGLVRESCPT